MSTGFEENKYTSPAEINLSAALTYPLFHCEIIPVTHNIKFSDWSNICMNLSIILQYSEFGRTFTALYYSTWFIFTSGPTWLTFLTQSASLTPVTQQSLSYWGRTHLYSSSGPGFTANLLFWDNREHDASLTWISGKMLCPTSQIILLSFSLLEEFCFYVHL